MGKTDDGGLSAEVTSRLDELFSEDDDSFGPDKEPAAEKKAVKKAPAPVRENKATEESDAGNAPASELKALVFGIDWEITDETMVAFLEEVTRLRQRYSDDKILSMYLKLHESIGKYIKVRKARAHPDAIKFVTTVFKNFEKVLNSHEMPESRKKRLLAGDIRTFKDFKERVIAQEKTPARPEPVQDTSRTGEAPTLDAETVQTPAPESPLLQNQEALDYIVGELKKVIQAEFHTMRQILKNLGA